MATVNDKVFLVGLKKISHFYVDSRDITKFQISNQILGLWECQTRLFCFFVDNAYLCSLAIKFYRNYAIITLIEQMN